MTVLVEEAEGALLGLVATAGQVLQRLATGGLLPAAHNATVLVLDQVGLLETAGGVLGISVKNRGFGSNGRHFGHLIVWTSIFLNEPGCISALAGNIHWLFGLDPLP